MKYMYFHALLHEHNFKMYNLVGRVIKDMSFPRKVYKPTRPCEKIIKTQYVKNEAGAKM